MKLHRIIEVVEGQGLTRSIDLGADIRGACSADLMSDVLASARPHTVLLTGLCNSQIVRTAQMADIAAVIIVQGRRPSAELIRLADQEGIPLIRTCLSMYEACGRLFQAELADGSDFPSDGQ